MREWIIEAEGKFGEFLDRYSTGNGTFALCRNDTLGKAVFTVVPYGHIKYIYSADYVGQDKGLTKKKLQLAGYVLEDGTIVVSDMYPISQCWISDNAIERIGASHGYKAISERSYRAGVKERFHRRVRELYDATETDEASLKERICRYEQGHPDHPLDKLLTVSILSGSAWEPDLQKLICFDVIYDSILIGETTAEEAAEKAFEDHVQDMKEMKARQRAIESLTAKSSIPADPLYEAYQAINAFKEQARFLTICFGDRSGQIRPHILLESITRALSRQDLPQLHPWDFKTKASAVPDVSVRDITKVTFKGKTIWEPKAQDTAQKTA